MNLKVCHVQKIDFHDTLSSVFEKSFYFKTLFFNFMCIGVLCASMSVYNEHVVSGGSQKNVQIPWDWTNTWWQAAMWILRIELGSFG